MGEGGGVIIVWLVSGMSCKQLLQRTSKLLAGFLPNMTKVILIWPSSVPVSCITS